MSTLTRDESASTTNVSEPTLPRTANQSPSQEAGKPLAFSHVVIAPPRGWQLINLRELWQFRDLLFFLTWRDVKVRYKQTVLGVAWAVLQPLMMMVVFSIFFGRMAGMKVDGPSYQLFAYAGLLPWTFFATAVANAGASVVGSERLITKIYFPRLAIPFTAVSAAVVDFVIALGLLLGMMLYYQVMPGAGLLLAPLFFFVIVLAALGMGTLLAALNVAYRDFRYVIGFLLQIWLFATPSVYMQVDPHKETGPFASLLALNPMTGLIAAFRASVLGGDIDWAQVGISSAIVVGVFLLGCFYFRKVEDSFADII